MSTQEPAVEREPRPLPLRLLTRTYVYASVPRGIHTPPPAPQSPLSLSLSQRTDGNKTAMAGVAAMLLKSRAGAMVKSSKQEKEVSVWLAASAS